MSIAAPFPPSPRALDASAAVIADARRRQRRRRTAIGLALILSLGAFFAWRDSPGRSGGSAAGSATAAAQTAAIANPCALLTQNVVAHAAEIRIAYSQPAFHQCTWAGYSFARRYGQKEVVVSLAPTTRAEFDQIASYMLAPKNQNGALVRQRAQPIANLGERAYWFPNLRQLAVYHDGVTVYLNSVLLDAPFASEKALAGAIIERIDKLHAQSGLS